MANTDRNPQNGLQGSSYIYKIGTSPNTRAVVSQKVRVLAPASLFCWEKWMETLME